MDWKVKCNDGCIQYLSIAYNNGALCATGIIYTSNSDEEEAVQSKNV